MGGTVISTRERKVKLISDFYAWTTDLNAQVDIIIIIVCQVDIAIIGRVKKIAKQFDV